MKPVLRLIGLLVAAAFLLQVFLVGRIALMTVVDPQSTSFQRSEAWRVTTEKGSLRWRQQWVPYNRISGHLKRAVVAAEDAKFVSHNGFDWDGIQKAFEMFNKYVYAAQKVPGQMDEARLGELQKFYVTNGVVPKETPLKELYTNQFVMAK